MTDGTAPHGMASTIVALLVCEDRYTVANVGDSEAFCWSDGRADVLTRLDVPRDTVGPRGFRSSSLTQYLGGGTSETAIDVHVRAGVLTPGMRFLLCSDGLTNAVPFPEIDDIVRHSDERRSLTVLIDECLEAGRIDDVSLILVEGSSDAEFS